MKAVIEVTTKDISNVAVQIFGGVETMEAGRVSYLRLLITATQLALGGKSGQPEADQLKALRVQHDRFYEVVLGEAEQFVPRGTRDRAVLLHKRANFARTTLSALRNHVRAGEDIAKLNAAKTTKGSLAVPKERRPRLNARRLKANAELYSKRLVAAVMGLADTDKDSAAEEIRLVIAQLREQLDTIVGHHVRVRAPRSTSFRPSETTVMRATQVAQ